MREGARISEQGFKAQSIKLETIATCEEFENTGNCNTSQEFPEIKTTQAADNETSMFEFASI